jgi:hypothetical protein
MESMKVQFIGDRLFFKVEATGFNSRWAIPSPFAYLSPIASFSLFTQRMPTLHWIGKEKVSNHHLDVPYRALEHLYGYEAATGKTDVTPNSGNKIIHCNNFEALKSLLPEYEGKAKCISIDSPYNMGNEGWVYHNSDYKQRSRSQLGSQFVYLYR